MKQLATLNSRRLRLISGVVLFTYVLTHFVNHALGLVSLEALEHGRQMFLWLWRNPLGTTILYGALIVHLLLALWAIYRRRSFRRMPRAEVVQLVFGLTIVPLLAKHVLGTRFANMTFGIEDSYVYVLLNLWVFDPGQALQQAVALTIAWVHGCLGLYFWLRLRAGYERVQPLLYAGALLVPVLALVGFYVAGRDVAVLARDPEWLRSTVAAMNLPPPDRVAAFLRWQDFTIIGFGAALGLTLAARAIRMAVERRHEVVRILYPGAREIAVRRGTSVLEASQLAGIPHASVCGGRGRCSTCRVRITRGLDAQPPPAPQESAVLHRIAAPPNVRLACQLRPEGDVAVVPLLPSSASARDARPRHKVQEGDERIVAVLFADLRDFTSIAEHRLPYDTVFVLNRYFAVIGHAAESAGGRVDKFIGDGMMALFGIDTPADVAARQALEAARTISLALHDLNATLAHDLEQPLRIGIGVHAGPVVVGEMGYGRAVSLTAIGDTINTASRLEALTKDFAAELVVSDATAELAGVELSQVPVRTVEIRGRREPLTVRAVARASDLPTGAAVKG